jgi:hypothetical protein
MIIRIATEGQYELTDGELPALHELDRAAAAACEADDEPRFREVYARLLELVRTQGRVLTDDELAPSDLILPPPDVTLEEAREGFGGEGFGGEG